MLDPDVMEKKEPVGPFEEECEVPGRTTEESVLRKGLKRSDSSPGKTNEGYGNETSILLFLVSPCP